MAYGNALVQLEAHLLEKRILLVDDEAVRNARLALLGAARQVLRNGFAILGIAAPESPSAVPISKIFSGEIARTVSSR